MGRKVAYKGKTLFAQASGLLMAQPQTRLVGYGKKYGIESFVSYGYLYNWYAVNKAVAEDDDGYSLAPEGWHVPTDAELTTLENYIDTNYNTSPNDFGVSSHLKHCRMNNHPLGGVCDTAIHPRWSTNNTYYGRNTVDFSAIPGGLRNIFGNYGNIGLRGVWWSSTESSSTLAWFHLIRDNQPDLERDEGNKIDGYSIRLIRDNDTGWTEGETVEIDGHTYDTVKIGDQVWMVQNLATTKYRNGEDIPNVTDNTDWANDEAGARCAYNNDEGNVFVNFEWLKPLTNLNLVDYQGKNVLDYEGKQIIAEI